MSEYLDNVYKIIHNTVISTEWIVADIEKNLVLGLIISLTVNIMYDDQWVRTSWCYILYLKVFHFYVFY